MNFIERLKFAFTNNLNDLTRAFMEGEDVDASVGPLDQETALKYSAVFACCRVLSETLACLPLFVYRKEKEEKKLGNDIGLYDILHSEPNYEMTPFNFKESLMMNLCLGGNGFAQKVFSKSTVPELLALYPIEYSKVEITRPEDTKKLTYKIKNGTVEPKTMTRDYIFHVPGLSINGIQGLTPIQYAAGAIDLGLKYELFSVNFYKNGANTNIVVHHPKGLSEVAFERFKKQIDSRQTGIKNVNKPWLIEEGTDIKEITINPVDAELLQSKYFSIEEICRIYRVPLHLVQHLLRATNNNIEHQGLEFIIYTMLPWAKRIEENANLQLLTKEQRKAGYFTEFKFDALLRGDAPSRAQAYAAGRQWGWLSVNDIRRLENMDGIGPAGDIYIQPLNFTEAGKDPKGTTKAMAEEIFKMIDSKNQGE